jgi:hypothetical protein
MNDRIVQITVKGEQLIGITATGHLARFDENLGAWIIRGKAEVLDSNNKIVLDHVTTNNVPTTRGLPVERQEVVEKTEWWELVLVVVLTLALAVSIVAGFIYDW